MLHQILVFKMHVAEEVFSHIPPQVEELWSMNMMHSSVDCQKYFPVFFDPSTPPAGAEHLHFTLNRETRRSLRLPVARAQMAWEDKDKVSLVVPWYSHRQPWARAA
jgi:hypothetical protein